MQRMNRSSAVLKASVDCVDYFLIAMEDTLAPVDLLPQSRPLRAPASLPNKSLRKVEIVLRPPQTTWIQDDSRKATALLDGLSSYLRSRDPR